jgi:hypothetical protein
MIAPTATSAPILHFRRRSLSPNNGCHEHPMALLDTLLPERTRLTSKLCPIWKLATRGMMLMRDESCDNELLRDGRAH